MCAARGINALGLDAAGVVELRVEDELEMLDSFEGNALAKARHFHAQTGLPTAADDSGLVVPALGGLPGVKSKRWSGRPDLTGRALDDENNRLLLERLRGSGKASLSHSKSHQCRCFIQKQSKWNTLSGILRSSMPSTNSLTVFSS